MIHIRPVSNLRNKYPEIENLVLANELEMRLDEADKAADSSPVRDTGAEAFGSVRKRVHERKAP